MITRLKVRGFKNLVDIDVLFGPFTCIAGANGVGKSNIFDAIRFLSALTGVSLKEAARVIRNSPRADVRTLFHRVGDWHTSSMFFEVEMIVPETGEDDFGTADASMTFLRYTLELGYREEDDGLEILQESLVHINKGEAPQHLLFKHSKSWRDSVITGRLTSPLISVVRNVGGETLIQLHQNAGGKGGGRPMPIPAKMLRRTLINQANSSEHKTAVVARNEMKSWMFLQLEPTALRESDKISESGSVFSITPTGNHMPSVLYNLSKIRPNVYESISLILIELVK